MTEPAPSPYLPGTHVQVAWDSTSLGYLKTCPRLYEYTMIKGYSSRDESVHLRFGIEYHHALQDYDLSRAAGILHDDAVHDVIRELLLRTGDFNPDHKTKTREGLVRTVIWYLDNFKDDPARTLILSDGKAAVEQSFRFELDWGPQAFPQYRCPSRKSEDGGSGSKQAPCDGVLTQHHDKYTMQGGCDEPCSFRMHPDSGEKIHHPPYILCGHLDKVVTYNDALFVMDHKTTAYDPTSWYFSKYEPDNQMTLYSLAAKVVLNAPIKGVIIDAAQVGDTWTKFGRGFTFRSPDQLEEWLADLRYWLTLAEQFAISGHWPQNDTACDKFGGCRFREVCSKSPQVRESFLESNFIKLKEEDRWNPLKAR